MSAANDPAVTRRLAAILIADVVGYTRLMERDDTGTFSRLRTIRDEVVDPAIVSHGGRIVKTAGDGLLAEFASALSALRAAVQVQREMAARNADIPADVCIEYRIGINLGDVMVDGSDLAGDGINVASRLEALCEPGGICVSGSVREQVHGTVDVGFEDIGEQQVKNIARPIRAFAVRILGVDARTAGADANFGTAAQAQVKVSAARKFKASRVWLAASALVGIAAVVLIASPLQLWPFYRAGQVAPPALSVAVLPLRGPVDDANASQRLTSLSRDLSSQLSAAGDAMHVVPAPDRPTSAESSQGMIELAKALGVRYVLDGVVQLGTASTEIRLRLINGTTGQQVSSEAFAVKEPATSVEQKRALRKPTIRIANRLYEEEIKRASADSSSPVTATDFVLRAWALDSEDKSLDRFHRQQALYEEALRRDPDFVPALIGVSEVLDGQLDLDSNVDRERLIQRMDEVTKRAVFLKRDAPGTWEARSGALMYMGRWDAALEANATAIQLDPDSASLIAGRAWSMSMIGRPSEALTLVAQSRAMDPGWPGSWWTIRVGCEAHLLLGQYEQAIAACEKAAGHAGLDFDIAYFLAAAYAQTGATARAREETAKILRVSPGFSIAGLRAKRYSTHPDYMKLAEEYWYSGLRKAGIPEQ